MFLTKVLREEAKRMQYGLYAGRQILHGNTVSEMGNRNPRTWKPNVHRCSLYSEILGKQLRIEVTTTALKRIDYAGGLDNYILKQTHPESIFAKKLKDRLLKTKYELELKKEGKAATAGSFEAA